MGLIYIYIIHTHTLKNQDGPCNKGIHTSSPLNYQIIKKEKKEIDVSKIKIKETFLQISFLCFFKEIGRAHV